MKLYTLSVGNHEVGEFGAIGLDKEFERIRKELMQNTEINLKIKRTI